MFTVTDTTLARKTMVAVLYTVTLNNFNIISAFLGVNVGPDGELNTIYRSTSPYDGKSGFRMYCNSGSFIEVVNYTVQEIELLSTHSTPGANSRQHRGANKAG